MRDIKNKLTSSKNSNNIQNRRGKSFGFPVTIAQRSVVEVVDLEMVAVVVVEPEDGEDLWELLQVLILQVQDL